MTSQSRTEAIRERHADTWPGEWRVGEYEAVRGKTPTVCGFRDGKWVTHIATVFLNVKDATGDFGWIDFKDAEFIAHAHQDIPWLLDQLTLAHETMRKQAQWLSTLKSDRSAIRAPTELSDGEIIAIWSQSDAYHRVTNPEGRQPPMVSNIIDFARAILTAALSAKPDLP